jgi:hypothetical protein
VRNLSRSLSFSILNKNGENIDFRETFMNNPIQLFIPRDPNLIITKMFRQNVMKKNVLFNYHSIDLQMNYSIHIEIHSLINNISYLFIYKFDSAPQLTSSMKNIDGWDLFCSSNENEIFSYFIDNNRTFDHQSIIFGIRELSDNEIERFCETKPSDPPITENIVPFLSDYEIRSYLSACFYLNENNQWKSDELIVSL